MICAWNSTVCSNQGFTARPSLDPDKRLALASKIIRRYGDFEGPDPEGAVCGGTSSSGTGVWEPEATAVAEKALRRRFQLRLKAATSRQFCFWCAEMIGGGNARNGLLIKSENMRDGGGDAIISVARVASAAPWTRLSQKG